MQSRDQTLMMFVTVCEKPNMYVQSRRYGAVYAFIEGINVALQDAPLMGFREWLLTQAPQWTNLPWWALVRQQVRPDANLEFPPSDDEGEECRLAPAALLRRFASIVGTAGLERIYYDYAQWLLARRDRTTAIFRKRLRQKPRA